MNKVAEPKNLAGSQDQVLFPLITEYWLQFSASPCNYSHEPATSSLRDQGAAYTTGFPHPIIPSVPHGDLLVTWCPPSPAVSTCDKLLSPHLSSVECLVFTHPHYLMGGDPFCHHWVRRRQLINMGIPAYAEPSSRELPLGFHLDHQRTRFYPQWMSGLRMQGQRALASSSPCAPGECQARGCCAVFSCWAPGIWKMLEGKGQYFVEEDQRGIAKVLTFLAPSTPSF